MSSEPRHWTGCFSRAAGTVPVRLRRHAEQDRDVEQPDDGSVVVQLVQRREFLVLLHLHLTHWTDQRLAIASAVTARSLPDNNCSRKEKKIKSLRKTSDLVIVRQFLLIFTENQRPGHHSPLFSDLHGKLVTGPSFARFLESLWKTSDSAAVRPFPRIFTENQRPGHRSPVFSNLYGKPATWPPFARFHKNHLPKK